VFDCDILIVPSREDAMWKSDPEDTQWMVYPVTHAGLDVYEHYFWNDVTAIMNGLVFAESADDAPLGCRMATISTKMMRRVVRYARQPNRDLTVTTYFMSPAQAGINARYLANKAELKRIESDAADLFGPLLDAAIAARDKREITTLLRNHPDNVTRSFIIMRLRDEFPELKEAGVTLDNWHEHGERAQA